MFAPRKRGLPLATDALEHIERWMIDVANSLVFVVGNKSPLVEDLRGKAWYLKTIREQLAEDAAADQQP